MSKITSGKRALKDSCNIVSLVVILFQSIGPPYPMLPIYGETYKVRDIIQYCSKDEIVYNVLTTNRADCTNLVIESIKPATDPLVRKVLSDSLGHCNFRAIS